MSKGFPGPHHCIGTARRVGDAVFETVLAACRAQGGCLTLAQIEAVRDRHHAAMSANFGLYRDIHDRCMAASLDRPHAHPNDGAALLALMLHAHTARLARAVFHHRIAGLGERWLHGFFNALAGRLLQLCGADLETEVLAAYVEAGCVYGQMLSVGEFVHTDGGRAAMRTCLSALVATPPSTAEIERLDADLAALTSGPSRPAAARGNDVRHLQRFFTMLPHARPVRDLLGDAPTQADAPAPSRIFVDDPPALSALKVPAKPGRAARRSVSPAG